MSIIGKIKVLLRIQKPAKKLLSEVKNMKSGWRTSEFWTVVVSNLVAVVGALNGVLDAETAAKVLGVLNAVYAILRTLAKAPEPSK
jgi:hypothetical protein